MAWNEKGDDRGKRYAVYQELEQRYTSALATLEKAVEEIERKNALIKALAEELASLRPQPESAAEATLAPANTAIPPDMKSSPYMHYPPVKPGLAKTKPTQTLAEKLEELQAVIHGPTKEAK